MEDFSLQLQNQTQESCEELKRGSVQSAWQLITAGLLLLHSLTRTSLVLYESCFSHGLPGAFTTPGCRVQTSTCKHRSKQSLLNILTDTDQSLRSQGKSKVKIFTLFVLAENNKLILFHFSYFKWNIFSLPINPVSQFTNEHYQI